MWTLFSIALIAAFVTIAITVWYFLATYNRLVSAQQQVRAAWAQIDVRLKQRWDLIPNLVATVQGYAMHEERTLQRVIQARALCTQATEPPSRLSAERELGESLRSLIVTAESYPVLKADGPFKQLLVDLRAVEDALAHTRQFYNDVVSHFNGYIQSFPTILVAYALRLQTAEFFSLGHPSEKTVPGVAFSGV